MGRRVRERAAGEKVSFTHDGLSEATTTAATTATTAATTPKATTHSRKHVVPPYARLTV